MSRLVTVPNEFDFGRFVLSMIGLLLAVGVITLPVDQYQTQQTALLFLVAGHAEILSFKITGHGPLKIGPAGLVALLIFGLVIIAAIIRTLAILLGA